MHQILVTGATGNVGLEVIRALSALSIEGDCIAAVRSLDSAKEDLSAYTTLRYRRFDFEDASTFAGAFHKIDILFLLRPPHLSDVNTYFRPLLTSAKENGVDKVIFLSVQGAGRSKVIPHNQIERLIIEMKFDYIFVRPGYFMQNLTTTLLPELLKEKKITLPAGRATFNWIDVRNIGSATAALIQSFEKHKNKAFEITGLENKSFDEVVRILSEVTRSNFTYKSVNPIRFYLIAKRRGLQSGFALVMTLLHFLPRLQAEPNISQAYEMLTGKKPTSLKEFVSREKEKFLSAK